MQSKPAQASLKAATEIGVGPVKVDFVKVVQFTVNLNISRFVFARLRKSSGDPVGGAVAPSISAGNKLSNAEVWKHTSCAVAPAIICARLKAHTCDARNAKLVGFSRFVER